MSKQFTAVAILLLQEQRAHSVHDQICAWVPNCPPAWEPLRVHQTLDAGEQIASRRAFVATVTTRLAINELRSARVRRERYVGEWLPEPI
ncbi:MAG: hypothetical protein DLM70_04615, partial [Chloroflexi bacterium]